MLLSSSVGVPAYHFSYILLFPLHTPHKLLSRTAANKRSLLPIFLFSDFIGSHVSRYFPVARDVALKENEGNLFCPRCSATFCRASCRWRHEVVRGYRLLMTPSPQRAQCFRAPSSLLETFDLHTQRSKASQKYAEILIYLSWSPSFS